MSAVDEIPREQPGTAANLQHQTAARSDRFEQFQDPRRDRVGMEPEALVVNTGEIYPVIRRALHRVILPSPCAETERPHSCNGTAGSRPGLMRGSSTVTLMDGATWTRG